jgi:hypothetical protein
MTVETTLTKVQYAGNGAATEFPVPFTYSRAADLRLILSDAAGSETVVADNFQVNVNGSGNTSVVCPVSGSPLPPGTKLTIYRDTPQTQIVDLIDGGDFNPDVLEIDGFDRLEMQIQELQEGLDRAVKVKISDAETPEELRDRLFQARDEAGEAQAAAANSASQANAGRNAAAASATAAANSATAAQAAKDLAADSAAAAYDAQVAAEWARDFAADSAAAANTGRNEAAASASQSANSSVQAANAAAAAAGVVAAVTAKLDGMIGLINNFFGMAMECCGSLEDYRYVFEGVTKTGDDGAIAHDPVAKTDDWGGLTVLLS